MLSPIPNECEHLKQVADASIKDDFDRQLSGIFNILKHVRVAIACGNTCDEQLLINECWQSISKENGWYFLEAEGDHDGIKNVRVLTKLLDFALQ